MTCDDVDLKEYFLGESSPTERRSVEAHAASCEGCRTELERLGVMRTALLAVREEEPPRRIAFVSDPVFEPSPWKRFWQSVNPVALLANAALAGIVAFGIVITQMPGSDLGELPESALENRVNMPVSVSSTEELMEHRVAEEVARRLGTSIQEAVSSMEERQQAQAAEMVKAVEQRLAVEHREQMLIMEASLEMLNKRMNTYYRAAADFGGGE